MTHVFDEATAVEEVSPGVFRAHTHPAYNNMVGPFGGITAATVVVALQSHPDVLGQPLALTINYAAPIGEGELNIAVTVLRTNRTNQHFTFVIDQGDGAVASGTAVFGIRRGTWGDTDATFPQVPAPETLPDADFPEFIAWARNYEKRFVEGSIAQVQEESDSSVSTLWLRDKPARPLDYASLTSLTDAYFPRVFLRRGTYLPAGTITLTSYFHASPDELAAQGDGYVLGTARAARFGHGHFDQDAQVWGADGTLLATTHQLVYYKDPQV